MLKWGGLLAVSAAASVLLGAPCFAAEILINQNKAQNGNVTPGDAAGFPVTISRSGKYKLGSNLVVPAGQTGIEVTAHGVTLDLNGFTIHNIQLGFRGLIGIEQKPALARLTVMNGSIVRFQTGIKAPGPFSVVENTTVIDNSQNGIEVGNLARVSNNTAQNNGWAGIALGNDSRASQNILSLNAATVGTSAIHCQERCLIERNVVTQSVNGPGVFTQNGGLVIGNLIAGNKSFGLSADGAGTGFGHNMLINNNNNGVQVSGILLPLDPNACQPAAPQCP
jgi:hypothetical protein